MKRLNITFNFSIPEDELDVYAASDLADFIIDHIWETMYDMNYQLENYTINVENTQEYIRDYTWLAEEDEDDASE